jgi:hypothetical protein
MGGVDNEVTEVVISVLENFVAKAGEGNDEDLRDRAIFEVIKQYLEIIEGVAGKNVTTKFFLADPILHPKLDW